ncbi:MAG: M56 family metallopeptidase [Candidatus Kerfeldbacteria bacterium]|nr:M56 family metallopeptidase [Candidatus Kerfeldbacteria bacterium]
MNYSRLFRIHEWGFIVIVTTLLALSAYLLIHSWADLHIITSQLLQRHIVTCGCAQFVSITEHPYFTAGLLTGNLLAAFFLTTFFAALGKQFFATRRFLQSLVIVDTRTLNKRIRIAYIQSEKKEIFTAGWWKPTMYISTTVRHILTSTELESVILHEIGHIRHFDIIKKYILFSAFSSVRWIPGIRKIQESINLAQEFSADAFAIQKTARTTLLAAFTKCIQPNSMNTATWPYPLFIATFTSGEARLQNLLLYPVRFPYRRLLLRTMLLFVMFTGASIILSRGFSLFDTAHAATWSGLTAKQCVEDQKQILIPVTPATKNLPLLCPEQPATTRNNFSSSELTPTVMTHY